MSTAPRPVDPCPDEHPVVRAVETRFPVLPAIYERWSPRSFASREPESHKLRSMFEAARLAPSAHNSQPARFLVGRKGRDGVFERLFACLDPHNREWAHQAPMLILAATTRQRFSQAKGDYVPYPHCMHDLGLAVMSMIIQAQHLGLYSHPMAAFDPERAQSLFDIPPLFAPGLMIAVGYLGSAEALPEPLRRHETAQRIRRPLEELVFEGGWGQPSSLFVEEEVEP